MDMNPYDVEYQSKVGAGRIQFPTEHVVLICPLGLVETAATPGQS